MTLKIIFSLLALFAFSLAARAQTPAPPPPPKKTVKAEDLTAREVAALEADLLKNPKDTETRKLLILYYSRDAEQNAESRKSVRRHRLLLIQNAPAETFYGSELGYWEIAEKDDPEYAELRAEYIRQAALHKTEVAVRLRAVEFIEEADPQAAEKLLLEGRTLAPDDEEISGKLLVFYGAQSDALAKRFDAGDKTVTETDIDRATEKYIAEGESRAAFLSKTEYGKASDERLEIFIKLSNAALELNDAKRARRFAETILREFVDAEEPDASDNEAIFYGNHLLGRVAQREGNIAKAKEHLSKSVTLRIGDDWDINQPELDLAGELLLRGERQIVLEYLQKVESLTTNENVRRVYRRWQRLLKRNLMPFQESEN